MLKGKFGTDQTSPFICLHFKNALDIFYIYTFFLHGLLHASHSRNPARTSEIARLRLPFFLSARTCPELHVSFTCKHDMLLGFRHCKQSYTPNIAMNTPAATASALEALHIIQNEPERLEALWEATNYALKRFREAGFEIGATESPIIPLYVRDTDKTFMVTKLAFDEGVFINPVIPPACAPQDTLVRVALMATHTKEQIDRAVEKLVKAFKALDIL